MQGKTVHILYRFRTTSKGILYIDVSQHAREYKNFAQYARKYIDFTHYARGLVGHSYLGNLLFVLKKVKR